MLPVVDVNIDYRLDIVLIFLFILQYESTDAYYRNVKDNKKICHSSLLM